MNNSDLDFRELTVFQQLLKRRSVSEVALELGLSQPTVSRCLARLRQHFDDPLFVRTQHSMEPTPNALEIADSVKEILDLYHSQLSLKPHFDPATSKRSFSIAASEIGHLVLFPPLIKKFEAHSPTIKLTAVPLGLHSLIEELETGNTDIAFGSFPKLYAGVHERTLYKEHYVCLIRKDHPHIQQRPTLNQFKESRHVIVSAQGLGHIHEQAEKKLYEVCPEDNVCIVTHNFLVCAMLVGQSNFIATVPSKVAEVLGARANLRTIAPPIKLPPFQAKLYWHERFHREPANRWLRETIVACFT